MDALQELDEIEKAWQDHQVRQAMAELEEADRIGRAATIGAVLILTAIVIGISVVMMAVWVGTAHAEENDIAIALRVAREYELSPFQTRALLCTRLVENGQPGREYGVLHPQAVNRAQVVQARWAAGTIRKRLQGQTGLMAFARRWAPIGAANDPRDLNRHWIGNMEACLAQLTGGDDD